jgi:hypothetical protein
MAPSSSKKRKRQQEEKEKVEKEPVQTVILYERWHFDRLSTIAELTLDPQTEAVVSAVLRRFKQTGGTRLCVPYTAREFKQGRVYGNGLQGVTGWIRRICAGPFYHDIDMSNCSPKLLSQILERAGLCPPILKMYAADREDVFAQLRESDPRLTNVCSGVLKTVFLLGLHGGKHKNHLQKTLGFSPGDTEPVRVLKHWEKSLRKALRQLREQSAFHRQLWEQIQALEKENPEGTFASWCWQVPENEIILALHEYFAQAENYTSGALIFDGLLLERKEGVPVVPDAVLRRAEAHILQTLGWEINLLEKPEALSAHARRLGIFLGRAVCAKDFFSPKSADLRSVVGRASIGRCAVRRPSYGAPRIDSGSLRSRLRGPRVHQRHFEAHARLWQSPHEAVDGVVRARGSPAVPAGHQGEFQPRDHQLHQRIFKHSHQRVDRVGS